MRKSISPLALQHRKPLEFHESEKALKTSPGNPNDVLFRDHKIKDRLLGYVHKNRENREKMRSMANKLTNQLRLRGDSEDSQDSEIEGYNEQLSKIVKLLTQCMAFGRFGRYEANEGPDQSDAHEENERYEAGFPFE